MKIPGLVDLQVNGYRGVDFSSGDLTERDFIRACRGILEAGTTAFLPTMITSAPEVYRHNLPMMATVLEKQEFRGRILGLHIEGPFLSPKDGYRGAHSAEWIREPDIDFLKQIIEWSAEKVKLLTIAAELEGAEELTRYAVSRGITVSLGHQMVGYEDLGKLVEAGATALTHLGNGLPSTLPRLDNPIWAGLGNDSLFAMIITDGHHLPVSVLKSIIRTKGAHCCIVVSDAAPLAGLAPGRYETLGNKVVLEESGRLYNPTGGHLVGSSATMLQCMNHLASLKLVSCDELLAMGFYNPLKLIGVDAQDVSKGRNIWFDEKQEFFYLEKNRI